MRRVTLLSALVFASAVVALALALPAGAATTKTITKTFSQSERITLPTYLDQWCADMNPFGSASFGNACPYPSVKSVGAFPRGSRILDVDLTLKGFTHKYPDEVDVLLVHRGVNRTVMSDVGGPQLAVCVFPVACGVAVRDITLVLDDEAAEPLPDTTPLDEASSCYCTPMAGGTYRPANYTDYDPVGSLGAPDTFPVPAPTTVSVGAALSGFDGSNPRGDWSLFVHNSPEQRAFYSLPQAFEGGWSITIKARVPA